MHAVKMHVMLAIVRRPARVCKAQCVICVSVCVGGGEAGRLVLLQGLKGVTGWHGMDTHWKQSSSGVVCRSSAKQVQLQCKYAVGSSTGCVHT
jgi:hypothetical protein